MAARQAIIPHLWFETGAEAAVAFYVSTFPRARVTRVVRRPGADEGAAPLAIGFEIDGTELVAFDGRPPETPGLAVSLLFDARSQAEIDHLWDALCAGGRPMACGWVTDRYGVTWQINTTRCVEMIADPDPVRAERAMNAMMGMIKIDIAALEAAHAGRSA